MVIAVHARGILFALVVCLIWATPASAATMQRNVDIATVDRDGQTAADVVYVLKAGAGEVNRVTITRSGASTIVFRDAGASIGVGASGCTSVSATEVRCTAPASIGSSPVTSVAGRAETGDRDDSLSVGASGDNSTADLGPGNDSAVLDGVAQASGGAGNDLLSSNVQQASFNGDDGNDRITIGSRPVVGGFAGSALGGAGNDVLLGGPGDESIGSGVFDGGPGNDLVDGRAGDDLVDGGDGTDVVLGGSGNDIVRPGLGRGDRADGGPGRDRASFHSLLVPATVDLSNRLSQGSVNGEGDVLVNFEGGSGSRAADRLLGDGRPNTLVGNSGADYVDGRGGADELWGGQLLENASFDGGRDGTDTVIGRSGRDRLRGGFDGRDLLDAGSGDDVLFPGDDEPGEAASFNTLARLRCGAGKDTVGGLLARNRVGRGCEIARAAGDLILLTGVRLRGRRLRVRVGCARRGFCFARQRRGAILVVSTTAKRRRRVARVRVRRIRRGKRRTVTVPLRPAAARALRRGRAVQLEFGDLALTRTLR